MFYTHDPRFIVTPCELTKEFVVVVFAICSSSQFLVVLLTQVHVSIRLCRQSNAYALLVFRHTFGMLQGYQLAV